MVNLLHPNGWRAPSAQGGNMGWARGQEEAGHTEARGAINERIRCASPTPKINGVRCGPQQGCPCPCVVCHPHKTEDKNASLRWRAHGSTQAPRQQRGGGYARQRNWMSLNSINAQAVRRRVRMAMQVATRRITGAAKNQRRPHGQVSVDS